MLSRNEIVLHDRESGNAFKVRECHVVGYIDNPKKGVTGAIVYLGDFQTPFEVVEVYNEIESKLLEARASMHSRDLGIIEFETSITERVKLEVQELIYNSPEARELRFKKIQEERENKKAEQDAENSEPVQA